MTDHAPGVNGWRFLRKRIAVSVLLKRPRSWRDDAYNLAAFDAWDREQRRRQGWCAGLGVWKKTNVPGSRVLISRHWPHLLCWQWGVWVGRYQGREMDGPRRFALTYLRPYRIFELRLFGPYVRITWQDSDWMLSRNYSPAGPKILWQHHLEAAEPHGSA